VSTLADIRKAAEAEVHTWLSDSTPGHFVASTVIVGLVTDYLCAGDLGDRAVTGGPHRVVDDPVRRSVERLPRYWAQGRRATGAVDVRGRGVRGDDRVTTNPATRYGPVAEREFEQAAVGHKEKLTRWLDALPGLNDDDFLAEAASAIHGSALTNSWRGNWAHEDCRASAAHNEAKRRHGAAGHAEGCTGSNLYDRAFAQVWRSQGHSADAYPPRACDCGAAKR
jgi:hypothetical protein